MKRRTPAEEHQEAQNGHNGFLIIIHKGDFSAQAQQHGMSPELVTTQADDQHYGQAETD